jgi:hypothetical protein
MQNSDGGEFYEASSWEYSWYVPQDMASLVKAIGGPDTFRSVLRFKRAVPFLTKLQLSFGHILLGRFPCGLNHDLSSHKLIRISRISVMSLVSVSH